MAIIRKDIGEQFLNDMGIDTDMVERVVIVFEPGNTTVATVKRLVRLDHDRLEIAKEKYELVRREVEDEQETKQSAPAFLGANRRHHQLRLRHGILQNGSWKRNWTSV